ncbi:stage II sporulation protein R [Clostridium sp. MCC353]|uniref:stage II sporulation protein R n=1 Tax=Clostridium sp. MCC353 TaxID=2592646 RepID=UPI001C01C2AC|nr:stage II sporulation protein R [Clostridium sp. MCC353]MBT9776852.1 stage II sporulation protein R [Clostridium sp. MCC353]
MKYKKMLIAAVSLGLMVFLLAMNGYRQHGEHLASRIAPEIIRFHVRANSDSKKDQELKLQVRDYLLNTIYDDLGSSASKEEIKDYILRKKTDLERLSDTFIEAQGFEYKTSIEISNQYFPEKTYGDMTFPNGEYEAVTVAIGSGTGHNWWCVLYPPLCFTDAVYAEVPDTSKNTLKNLLAPEDYSELVRGDVEVRFKVLEWLGIEL